MFPRTEQATTLAATATGQQGDTTETTETTFTKGTIRRHIGKQFQETDERNEAQPAKKKMKRKAREV